MTARENAEKRLALALSMMILSNSKTFINNDQIDTSEARFQETLHDVITAVIDEIVDKIK